MECIAIINQKGGVGKTSTAANLGAGLAQRGLRMLLIDLDPQGHLTTHFGLDEAALGRGTYEVLTSNMPLAEATHKYSPNISVVPTHVDLAAAETELLTVVGREVILQGALSAPDLPYDVVLFDCPPSLSVLSLNAMSAASRVLIPVQPHFLALQGAGKLFETIALVSQRINPKLSVLGIVMCLYDAGTRLSSEVVDDLSEFLEGHRDQNVPWRDARIFESRIRRNVKLAECPSYGQSIFEYAPRSNGAIDYLNLADEVIGCLDVQAKGIDLSRVTTQVKVIDANGVDAGEEANEAIVAAEQPQEAPAADSEKSTVDESQSVGEANTERAELKNGEIESRSAPVDDLERDALNRTPPTRTPPPTVERQAS